MNEKRKLQNRLTELRDRLYQLERVHTDEKYNELPEFETRRTALNHLHTILKQAKSEKESDKHLDEMDVVHSFFYLRNHREREIIELKQDIQDIENQIQKLQIAEPDLEPEVEAAIKRVALKRSHASPVHDYDDIVKTLRHYKQQKGRDKWWKNVVKATGIKVPESTFSTWKDALKEELDPENGRGKK